MKALLDLHALLWFDRGDARLPAHLRTAISTSGNDLVLSVVTAWELVLKAATGRLSVQFADVPTYLSQSRAVVGYSVLDISLPHVLRAGSLPPHHKDAFDRLLVGQAIEEQLPIITADAAIARYGVPTIW